MPKTLICLFAEIMRYVSFIISLLSVFLFIVSLFNVSENAAELIRCFLFHDVE